MLKNYFDFLKSLREKLIKKKGKVSINQKIFLKSKT